MFYCLYDHMYCALKSLNLQQIFFSKPENKKQKQLLKFFFYTTQELQLHLLKDIVIVAADFHRILGFKSSRKFFYIYICSILVICLNQFLVVFSFSIFFFASFSCLPVSLYYLVNNKISQIWVVLHQKPISKYSELKSSLK